jgi:hypothetical protein
LGGNTLYTKWANEHESNRVACNAARARTILELSQPLQQSHVIDDLEAWLARRRLPAAIAELQPTHVRWDFPAAAYANFRRRRRLDSSHSSNSCPTCWSWPRLPSWNTLYKNWANEHESKHVACDAARARTHVARARLITATPAPSLRPTAYLAARRTPTAAGSAAPLPSARTRAQSTRSRGSSRTSE